MTAPGLPAGTVFFSLRYLVFIIILTHPLSFHKYSGDFLTFPFPICYCPRLPIKQCIAGRLRQREQVLRLFWYNLPRILENNDLNAGAHHLVNTIPAMPHPPHHFTSVLCFPLHIPILLSFRKQENQRYKKRKNLRGHIRKPDTVQLKQNR
jgi:hypothetical protein